jgi:transposase
MDSVELYRQLLGLTAPWTVERVELDMAKKHVEVHVGHSAGQRFACPECGRELGVYDHLAERVWRHLDSCQFLTYLHARPPRVSCPEHGVHQVSLPWAQPGSRFTNLFEALAIDVLLAANVKKAAEILRITWDEAWHLMERAVFRGRAAKSDAIPKQIGIDEKAIAKGHRYMTLVCDLEESTVEYIGEERKETSLAAYFDAFPQEQREKIEAISLDMWPAYINACRDKVPGADSKMVFDRFHIMRHVLDAVDKVRKQDLWSYKPPTWATKSWKRWPFWATHSRLPPMIEVARTIARHLPNVLTYFKHPVTNAVAEGLNSKIATVQKRACGFRNRDNFKIAVYFHCGGLNLYPARVTHSKAG